MTVLVGGDTADVDVDIEVWAEFLPDTGGHAHQAGRVRFDDVPLASDGWPNKRPFFYGLVGNPWTGYFERAGVNSASIQDTISSGQFQFAFHAGAIGGAVDVIAQAEVAGKLYTDTVQIQIRVPGLIDARTSGGVTNVYWIGGTGGVHPQGSNWYLTADATSAMRRVVDSMTTLDAGDGMYL